MIFKLLSGPQQNFVLFCFALLIIFLIYRLVARYYAFVNSQNEYWNVFQEPTIDHVTREKLIKYWKTKSYEDFFRNTLVSMEQSKEDTIVFTGLCQDNGKEVLKSWLPKLEKIGGYFKDYRIIIVENDSKDDTREVLLKAAEKNSKILILCDDEKPENAKMCQLNIRSVQNTEEKETTLAKRVGILGNFRQVYWNYIVKNFADYDYMCVLDWDLDGELSVPGFFHGLYYTRHFTEVVACNSYYEKNKGMFNIYDTYPLLNHHRCDYLRENKIYEDMMANFKMRDKLLYDSAHPFPIESAFGGLALYNIQKIKEKNPNYTERKCPVECEHSTFHRSLEVYIDPWMTFLITKNRH